MSIQETQNSRVLDHLKCGNTITPLDALELFGCFRLGARIFELRQEGHQIEKTMVTNDEGNKYAEYWLKV